jgi:trimeric autotransporter adhesin
MSFIKPKRIFILPLIVLGLILTVGAGFSAAQSSTSPTVVSFTFSPASIANGQTYTGTVTLSAPAPPGGAVVTLEENVTVLYLPGICTPICDFFVTIPAGLTSVSFSNTTNAFVTDDTGVLVTATLGSSSVSASIQVTPGVNVAKLSISPTSVVGGDDFTGIVTLASAAPAGGDVVEISQSQAEGGQAVPPLLLPIFVTIPAGQTTSATFSVGSICVTTNEAQIIFAQSGVTTVSVPVTVKASASCTTSTTTTSTSTTTTSTTTITTSSTSTTTSSSHHHTSTTTTTSSTTTSTSSSHHH